MKRGKKLKKRMKRDKTKMDCHESVIINDKWKPQKCTKKETSIFFYIKKIDEYINEHEEDKETWMKKESEKKEIDAWIKRKKKTKMYMEMMMMIRRRKEKIIVQRNRKTIKMDI